MLSPYFTPGISGFQPWGLPPGFVLPNTPAYGSGGQGQSKQGGLTQDQLMQLMQRMYSQQPNTAGYTGMGMAGGLAASYI